MAFVTLLDTGDTAGQQGLDISRIELDRPSKSAKALSNSCFRIPGEATAGVAPTRYGSHWMAELNASIVGHTRLHAAQFEPRPHLFCVRRVPDSWGVGAQKRVRAVSLHEANGLIMASSASWTTLCFRGEAAVASNPRHSGDRGGSPGRSRRSPCRTSLLVPGCPRPCTQLSIRIEPMPRCSRRSPGRNPLAPSSSAAVAADSRVVRVEPDGLVEVGDAWMKSPLNFQATPRTK